MESAITIRRQILEVHVRGTEVDGLALQRRLPGLCADVLTPALEQAFARVDPGNSHLYVDRLVIDVPDVSLDEIDAELRDGVGREIAEYFRRNPAVPAEADCAAEASGVRRRTNVEAVDDAVIVFLRTGRLPWWFGLAPNAELEQLVLDTWAAANSDGRPPATTLARLSEVLASPRARARLLMQFTPRFVMDVLRATSPALAAATEKVVAALDAPHPPTPPAAAFARRVWAAALAAASAHCRPAASELATTAWRLSSPADREERSLAALVERHWPGATEQRSAPSTADEVEAPAPTLSPAHVDRSEVTGALLVDNAGVVLLHPFLPRYFEALGVATDVELLDRTRALGLLHHLATGERRAPEHQLTVAKVLCGVPHDEPTEADVGLTDAERDEAIAVLDAAIRHWEAPGGTSPDAIRAEFLMRPGLLIAETDDDWLLRVEARTVDILLDELPWSLSYIRLPWMDRMLRVEWH